MRRISGWGSPVADDSDFREYQRRGCPHLRSRNPSSVGEAKFHSGLGGPSPTLPPGYEPGPGSRRVVARQEGGPFGQRNFGLER
jgi:hypothetical protein